MSLVFSSERWAEIRKSPDTPHAVLELRRDGQRPIGSPADFRVVRLARREVEAGRESTLARLDGGRDGYLEKMEQVATLIARENVDVFGARDESWGRALTKGDVAALGFRSLPDLRGTWKARHPHAEFGGLSWCLLGDRLDSTVWIASTQSMIAGRQGDYTQNAAKSIDRDAPLLTPAEYVVLARDAVQRDVARALAAQSRYAGESLAERAGRLERGSEGARDGFARDLRSITREKR